MLMFLLQQDRKRLFATTNQPSETGDQVLRTYSSKELFLRDICVTPDSKWMICAGQKSKKEGEAGPEQYSITGMHVDIRSIGLF